MSEVVTRVNACGSGLPLAALAVFGVLSTVWCLIFARRKSTP